MGGKWHNDKLLKTAKNNKNTVTKMVKEYEVSKLKDRRRDESCGLCYKLQTTLSLGTNNENKMVLSPTQSHA